MSGLSDPPWLRSVPPSGLGPAGITIRDNEQRSLGQFASMPPMSDTTHANDSRGPVELLLDHSEKILRLESDLRIARILRALFVTAIIAIPGGFAALYVATAVTWRKFNMVVVWWPAMIVILLLCGFVFVYLGYIVGANDYQGVSELRLELELARERRRMNAAKLNLDIETKQQSYKDGIPKDIDQYKREGRHYRRIHNFLQAIIIVGSLAASTLTGLVQYITALRWIAVGATFSVGVAAGFSGYFKFRERSFYLQLTADSIEQELSSVDLGIARYRKLKLEDALVEFTEQVELLKLEQRKRQQQLEQPSGGRESVQ
jgi:hypothetical protein